MTAVLAALATAAALLVAWPAPRASQRLARLRPPSRPGPGRVRPLPSVTTASVAVALGVAAIGGGARGAVLGIVAGVAVRALVARLEPAAARRRRERIAADLPLCLDLLASCLAAGLPLPEAASTVAAAVPGPLAVQLSGVIAVQRLGAAPGPAWATLEGPLLGAVGRTLSRAADSGAPLADTVADLAAAHRERARWDAEERARRAGVLAVGPLGLCFLPAFLLVGVVPTVAGLLSAALG